MKTYQVLVIEDDPMFQKYLAHQLGDCELFPNEVTIVSSAEEAIGLLDKGTKFDFILVDYYLPGESGEIFLQEVKKMNLDSGIISISANKNYKIAVELMKAGADDYISKAEFLDPFIFEKTLLSVQQKREYRKQTRSLEIQKERLDAIQIIIRTLNHEINNPLSIVKIASDVMRNKCALNSPACQDLSANITAGIDRVTDVLQRLSRFSTEEFNEELRGPEIFSLPQ